MERVPSLESLSEGSNASAVAMATASEGSDVPLAKIRGRGGGCLQVSSDSSSGTESDAVVIQQCNPLPKKGRGRPPTTGEYMGLAKAKAELIRLKQEELQLRAEGEMAEMMATSWIRRAERRLDVPVSEELLVADLKKGILDDVEIILNVAHKSKNLKGTFQKALKDAAASIVDRATSMADRTASEEMKKLQESYEALKANEAKQGAEMVQLRKEVEELRADLQMARRIQPTVSAASTSADNCMGSVTSPCLLQEASSPLLQTESSSLVTKSMLDRAMKDMESSVLSHLKAFESILLRPSLSGDKTSTEAVAPVITPEVHVPNSSGLDVRSNKKTTKKKKSLAAQAAEESRLQQVPSQTVPVVTEKWSTVLKRGTKKRAGQKQTATTKVTAAKLVVPRASAVVLTLRPGASDVGVDYRKVVSVAKDKVDLASLDIPFLKFKETASGARKLEVPGVTSSEKADRLAERLRSIFAETVGEGMVLVTRPTKCAELRIKGLDDSVTKEEVANAIATKGGCPVEQVKVGIVRRAPYGVGTVWVRCPIAAAKKVAQERRLLLGWVAVQVTLLQPRVARCFQCLEPGHIKQHCKAGIDRSGLCFQCGKGGHKATDCSASPHCILCAEAERPSNHRLGSKSCVLPSRKGGKAARKIRAASKNVATAAPSASTRSQGERNLEDT